MSNFPPANCSRFEYDDLSRSRVELAQMQEETTYLAMLLKAGGEINDEVLRATSSLSFVPKIGKVAILLRIDSESSPKGFVELGADVEPDGLLLPLDEDVTSGYLLSYGKVRAEAVAFYSDKD